MLSLDINKSYLDPDRYHTVGIVTTLLAGIDAWRGDLRKLINEEVIPAHRHGHIRFFYEHRQIPVGFVTWANLSNETENRIIEPLDPWLHISEWNEGPSLWIRYLYIQPSQLRYGIRLCMTELFPAASSIRCVVQRKGQNTVLELDRELLWRYAGGERPINS